MVKLLFSFQGRINRSQYWLGGLLLFAVLLVAIIFTIARLTGSFLNFRENGEIDLSIIPLFFGMGALYLVAVWCGASLNVKRLHDRGRSGWIAALAFLPLALAINTLTKIGSPGEMIGAGLMGNLISMLINLYFLVDLGMMPGKEEPNQYGEPPRPGDYTRSPPMRPAGTPAGVELAMERAISAAASPAAFKPSVQRSTPTATPSALASTTPKTFGRRA